MLESVLVADRGLGAARVMLTCRRLGIKAVLAGLSEDADPVPTDPGHLADDVVLLANRAELGNPVAVVRAARAAGVRAVHPGYGPLRGSAELARVAIDAGLQSMVTTGIASSADVAQALSAAAVPLAAAGTAVEQWVYVLAVSGRVVVLGSVQVEGDRVLSGAAPDLAGAHRLAHAAAAVLGLDGLAAVGIAAGGVVEVVAGLPEQHAVWELVTGLDLVELQLAAATDRRTPAADREIATNGVAVGLADAELIELRTLSGVEHAALRVDAVPVAGSPQRAVVRVSAWGRDRAAAELVLERYANRRSTP